MKRIDIITAFLSVDDKGDEGVCGIKTPTGWVPLIGADTERMGRNLHHAMSIATMTGRPVRIVQFSTRTLVDTIRPGLGTAPN